MWYNDHRRIIPWLCTIQQTRRKPGARKPEGLPGDIADGSRYIRYLLPPAGRPVVLLAGRGGSFLKEILQACNGAVCRGKSAAPAITKPFLNNIVQARPKACAARPCPVLSAGPLRPIPKQQGTVYHIAKHKASFGAARRPAQYWEQKAFRANQEEGR